MNKITHLCRVYKIILFFILLFLYAGLAVCQKPKNLWNSPLKKCWVYNLSETTSINIASDNESNLYIPLQRGIKKINKEGLEIWNLDLGGEINSNLLIVAHKLFVLNKLNKSNQSTYNEIDIRSGFIIKKVDWQFNSRTNIFTDHRNKLLLSNKKYIVNPLNSSDRIWNDIPFTEISTDIFPTEKELIFGTSNKTLVSLNRANGTINNQINLLGVPYGSIISIKEMIIFGDEIGNVYSFNLFEKKISWHTKTGGKVVRLYKWQNDVLVLSNDNYVYLKSGNKGDNIWKRKLAGRIMGAEFISKDKIMILAGGTNSAVVLDLSSGKVVNSVDIDSGQYFVSNPVKTESMVIIPSGNYLYGYSQYCKE